MKHEAKKTVRVHPEDVKMWAAMTHNPMFSEAAKKITALKGAVTILWHRGAKSLEVLPLDESTTAVRKRTRKQF